MRLVQQEKKETPSLPVWLGRDVPHERELAREMLDQLGGEKSLDYLLYLHDKEETQRQKLLRWHTIASWTCAIGSLATMIAIDIVFLKTLFRGRHPTLSPLFQAIWVWIILSRLLKFWAYGGKRKKIPFFLVRGSAKFGDCPA